MSLNDCETCQGTGRLCATHSDGEPCACDPDGPGVQCFDCHGTGDADYLRDVPPADYQGA